MECCQQVKPAVPWAWCVQCSTPGKLLSSSQCWDGQGRAGHEQDHWHLVKVRTLMGNGHKFKSLQVWRTQVCYSWGSFPREEAACKEGRAGTAGNIGDVAMATRKEERRGIQECRVVVRWQLHSKNLLIILGIVPADQQHGAAQLQAETCDKVLLHVSMLLQQKCKECVCESLHLLLHCWRGIWLITQVMQHFLPPLVLCKVLLARLVLCLLQCTGFACSWKNVFHSYILFTVRCEYFI